MYLTSGKYTQDKGDIKEKICWRLEHNNIIYPDEFRDNLGSKLPEADADSFNTFSFDDINNTYKNILDNLSEDSINVGHDLGRNEEMQTTLVPLTFTDENGVTQEVQNSRKSETKVETYKTKIPGINYIDGELKPGIFDAELHLDVTSDLMNYEFETGATSHEIWRLAQYENFKENNIDEDWELVEEMLSDDEASSGHQRTFSRLCKYHAYDVSSNLNSARKQNKILNYSFGPETEILDLIKGMKASSLYFGLKNSGAIEDTSRYIGTKRNERKYKEVSRMNRSQSPREHLLLGAPTWSELADDIEDLEETAIETDIKGNQKSWRNEHIIATSTIANRSVRSRFRSNTDTSDYSYEVAEKLVDPTVADSIATSAGAAELILVATASYMIGKAGIAAINNHYEE